MNPDQEPQGPQPMPPEQPVTPPAPEVSPTPGVEPAPTFNPAPAPVEPETVAPNPFGAPPAGPIGSSPAAVDTSAPAPASGSKKKLIILLSAIVGGLLILGGIAAAVYFMLFAVNKQDYQQAFDQVNVIRESIDESSVSATSGNEDALASATAAYEKYKVEHAKLGDLKAIKFDAEINEKYKAYDAKADEFISFMDSYLPSAVAFIEAAEALQSFSMTSASVQRAIDAYEDASGKVTDPTLKGFVDSSLTIYKKMLPQVKIYENTSNPTSQRLAAANELSTIARELSTAASTLADDLTERTEAISPEDTFNELGELITKKLNES